MEKVQSFGHQTDQKRKHFAALGTPCGVVVALSQIQPRMAARGAAVVGFWSLAIVQLAWTFPGMTLQGRIAMRWRSREGAASDVFMAYLLLQPVVHAVAVYDEPLPFVTTRNPFWWVTLQAK